MDIISRKTARSQGLKFYFTGKLCRNGHMDKRMSSNGRCMTCAVEYKRTEESKQHYKVYRKHHRDVVNRRSLDYYYYRYQEERKTLREENPDEAYKHSRKWSKENPGKVRAQTLKRKAQINKSTPGWYNHEKVREIYEECSKLTAETGIPHHVDHIVPLRGETVCGLHCHYNLQILTAKENLQKGNTLIESEVTP